MSRIAPLPVSHSPELERQFDHFVALQGFAPNSLLIMQRKPTLVAAFTQLSAAVMDPAGEVDLGLRRLIGHVASKAAGCAYCQAHTLLGASKIGVDEAKLADVWRYRESPHYSPAERAALDFALAAASQPNDVTNEGFARLRDHWSETQIVEILGVVALFGFMNRWNDSLATPLEDAPVEVARRAAALAGARWSPGKHGS